MFDGYIICGTPRTGSTLLCKLLADTGSAGNPDSFYGRQFIAEWAAEWNLPPLMDTNGTDFQAAYLAAAIKVGRGDTGIFGLRLMRENLDELSAILDQLHPGLDSDVARLAKAFGKLLYIHLSRVDKLGQAVSYIKAQQSGLWHVSPDGTELERLGKPQEPVYDFERIRQEVARLEAFDAAWNSWFAVQGIVPLRVSYESLSADPAETLARICTALGIKPPVAGTIRPGVAKLADAVSRDWMRRYERDLRGAK